MDWIILAQDMGPMAGPCGHGNEPSNSIKHWVILDNLGDWWLLKKKSAPWSQLYTNALLIYGVAY
jgi:hypothetical protein